MNTLKLAVVVCTLLVFETTFGQTSAKLIDRSNFDTSVKPGDNFYLYVNGIWLKNNPVPPSKTRWGTFDVLAEESSNALKGLLEDASKYRGTNSLMRRVGDYYASGMDTVQIEKLGYKPIKPFLNKIERVKTKQDVMNIVAYLRSSGIASPLINVGVRQDSRNVDKYVVGISQGGTSLPDRDYYLKNDLRSREVREAFVKYISDLFMLSGVNQATAKANADKILELETSIARA